MRLPPTTRGGGISNTGGVSVVAAALQFPRHFLTPGTPHFGTIYRTFSPNSRALRACKTDWGRHGFHRCNGGRRRVGYPQASLLSGPEYLPWLTPHRRPSGPPSITPRCTPSWIASRGPGWRPPADHRELLAHGLVASPRGLAGTGPSGPERRFAPNESSALRSTCGASPVGRAARPCPVADRRRIPNTAEVGSNPVGGRVPATFPAPPNRFAGPLETAAHADGAVRPIRDRTAARRGRYGESLPGL